MVLKMSAREANGSLSSLQQRPISDSLGNAVSGVMFLSMQKCLIAEILQFCDAVTNSSSFHCLLSSPVFQLRQKKLPRK